MKKPDLIQIDKVPAIGTEVFVWMGKKPEKMVVRGRLDLRSIKKANIGWGKEETQEHYENNYISAIYWYAKNGYLYTKTL